MKKLLAFSLIGSTLFSGTQAVKSNETSYGITQGDGYGIKVYSVNPDNGNSTLLGTYCRAWDNMGNAMCAADVGSDSYLDQTTGNLKIELNDAVNGNKMVEFNTTDKTFTEGSTHSNWKDNYQILINQKTLTKSSDGKIKLEYEGTKLIESQSNGSIQIGSDGNDIDITSEGLNVDGNPLITKKDNGEIHIGKNSLITKSEEETLSDGTKVQPLYAKDADGNKIPINIDGSKLLIDGVEVTAGDSAQVTTNKNNISTNTSNISTNTSNIKNLGEGVAGSTALTAALSALPQTSKESKLSCGVGTGAYSSRYALGFGCASKVNERVDINAGGSYVFGGSKSYGAGTLDSGVIKAGFVFKLGELNKPTLISMNEKEKMEDKIYSLEEKNEKILSKNKKLEDKVSTLIARLERLEKVALNESKSQDLATIKLP